jgi:hypothetical protein
VVILSVFKIRSHKLHNLPSKYGKQRHNLSLPKSSSVLTANQINEIFPLGHSSSLDMSEVKINTPLSKDGNLFVNPKKRQTAKNGEVPSAKKYFLDENELVSKNRYKTLQQNHGIDHNYSLPSHSGQEMDEDPPVTAKEKNQEFHPFSCEM